MERLTTPLVRENEALRPATWDEAIERAEQVRRPVEGDDGVVREAIDALVRARRAGA